MYESLLAPESGQRDRASRGEGEDNERIDARGSLASTESGLLQVSARLGNDLALLPSRLAHLRGLQPEAGRLGREGADRHGPSAERQPCHLEEVKHRREELIVKTMAAVKDCLTKEINYWNHRVEELKAQELAGRTPRLNSGKARQRGD